MQPIIKLIKVIGGSLDHPMWLSNPREFSCDPRS
jgi:hypothetical protein